MTPAERNLHDIAAAFCAPKVKRETCPMCGGASFVMTSSYGEPELHPVLCATCAGNGYVLIDDEETH